MNQHLNDTICFSLLTSLKKLVCSEELFLYKFTLIFHGNFELNRRCFLLGYRILCNRGIWISFGRFLFIGFVPFFTWIWLNQLQWIFKLLHVGAVLWILKLFRSECFIYSNLSISLIKHVKWLGVNFFNFKWRSSDFIPIVSISATRSILALSTLLVEFA